MIDSNSPQVDDTMTSAMLDGVRRMLLKLADSQESRAAVEAAQVPSWAPCPEAIAGYRTAAFVLREVAATLGASPAAA